VRIIYVYGTIKGTSYLFCHIDRHSIMFMGTPHFSKSTLFPFDPKAYTVPIHALKPVRAFSTTDRSASADPPPHNTLKSRPFALHRRKRDQGGHRHQQHDKAHAYSELKHTLRRHQHDNKSMTTMYDLHTFQPPSSHWIWLTPWLVNMRQDGVTDERGWEYNYIFCKHMGTRHRAEWMGMMGTETDVGETEVAQDDGDGEEEEDWQDDDASLDFVKDPFDDLEQGDGDVFQSHVRGDLVLYCLSGDCLYSFEFPAIWTTFKLQPSQIPCCRLPPASYTYTAAIFVDAARCSRA
jgi:hypothetical protein